MKSNLIVKNFGPIISVDMNLKNVNVFIGPQASGKSALAKVFTIFKAPRSFIKSTISSEGFEKSNFENEFKNILEEYNIASFLKQDTEIIFDSELHKLSYINGKIDYEPKLLQKIKNIEEYATNFDKNKDEILGELTKTSRNYILLKFKIDSILKNDEEPNLNNITSERCEVLLNQLKESEFYLSSNTSLYFPSERNFISIIKNASLNLQLNNVPIPKHLLKFGAELEKAKVERVDLNFISKNLIYKNINGEDKIFFNETDSINLTEAASGIQSVMPILLPIINKNKNTDHRSYVIEEPELNLFPKAQYALIKYLEGNRKQYHYWEDVGTIHTYTTHSPYILSALNNLLYAYKVEDTLTKNMNPEGDKNKIEEILKKVRQITQTEINSNFFTAYQISDGHAKSIFDEERGLIMDNFIDDSSEEINDDFDALMNLLENDK